MLKEIDHVTLYHPQFSVTLLRIDDKLAWAGVVEDNHTTPSSLKQVYGFSMSSDVFDGDVPATTVALMRDAAKTFAPLVGIEESEIVEYLLEQVEIIRQEKSESK